MAFGQSGSGSRNDSFREMEKRRKEDLERQKLKDNNLVKNKKGELQDKSFAKTPSKTPKSNKGGKSMDIAAAGSMLSGAMKGGDSSGGATSTKDGAVTGAANGAMAGSAAGPYGALIGGAVGGITGAMSAKANRQKAQAAAEATKQTALAGIATEKGVRINQALNSMAQAFGSTLKDNKFLGRF